MSNVRRVYVEKKGSYDVQQKALAHEIRNYLGIKDVEYVRILNRYDVENVSDETFERACNGIFAEPPVDVLWKEEAPVFRRISSGSVRSESRFCCSVYPVRKRGRAAGHPYCNDLYYSW